MANSSSRQLEDERNRCTAAVESFKIADQSAQDLRRKLKEEENAWKNADVALKGAQRQAEEQLTTTKG